jgi:hypothetical protein
VVASKLPNQIASNSFWRANSTFGLIFLIRVVWLTLTVTLKPVVVQQFAKCPSFLMQSMENATHRRNLIIIYIYVLLHVLMTYHILWSFIRSSSP